MDFELEELLNDYRDKLYNYLFTDHEITRWINNKKVLISNKFKPLLSGDWSRNYGGYHGMNLELLINTKINKTKLFEIIYQELNRTVTFKNNDYYIHNFNPNLFFLLFDSFFECKIKKNIITFESVTINENICGIVFSDNAHSIMREEIISLIEIHSLFILNKNIQKILTNDIFVNIFIKNCYIQYHVKKHNYHTRNRFIDMSYIINDFPFFIEINEKTHSEILDYYKELDVYLTTGSKLNSIKLYNEFFTIQDTFKKILYNFCVCLYKAGLKDQGIILHMVEFSHFEVSAAIVGVQMVNSKLNITLNSIVKLPFFDETNERINIDLLINYLYNENKIDPVNDFNNWIQIKKSYNKFNLPDIVLIINEKNNLLVKPSCLIKILSNIPTKMWSRQNDYFVYLQNLQTKYIQSITSLLDDNIDNKLAEKYIENKKIIELIKFDQDEYFYNIKQKAGNKLYLIFHEKLPFLKVNKQYGQFVDFNMYKHLVKQKYLDNLTADNIKKIKKKYSKPTEIILGYSIIDSNEIIDIYNMTQSDFNDRYLNI